MADWIIDLGPGAGARGGEVVAMGRPEDIVGVPESATGLFLRPLLQDRSGDDGLPEPLQED
jgi:excinuclease ABC subunit A